MSMLVTSSTSLKSIVTRGGIILSVLRFMRQLRKMLNWQRFCEVVIELYYQEGRLVLDNIYMRICLVHNHVTDQGLPIQQKMLQGRHWR